MKRFMTQGEKEGEVMKDLVEREFNIFNDANDDIKPSIRIREIIRELPSLNKDLVIDQCEKLISAIMCYLDEEWEKRQPKPEHYETNS